MNDLYTGRDYIQSGVIPVGEYGYEQLVDACENYQVPICILQVKENTVAHLTSKIIMTLALKDARGHAEDEEAIVYWDTLEAALQIVTGWYIRAYAAMGDVAALLFISQMRNHPDQVFMEIGTFASTVQAGLERRNLHAVQNLITQGRLLASKVTKLEDLIPEEAKLMIILALMGDDIIHMWIKTFAAVDINA